MAGRTGGSAIAQAAGWLLVWRAIAGRGLAKIPTALAGAAILRAARRRSAPAGGGARRRRRGPEVIEVKSPAELEPGIAAATPRPTFPDRVDRGPGDRPERRGGRDRRRR